MPEWLTTSTTNIEPDITTLALRLIMAWLAGVLVALIARRGKPVASRDKLTLTLILMSVLIAMATQIIGDNIARAFSLVGALSIVRFRTAVPATRDIAFVLAAVVVGMAIGAGQYWVCGLGLIVVALATFSGFASGVATDIPAADPMSSNTRWRVTLLVALHQVRGWEEVLGRYCESFQLQSAQTARRGGALEVAYDCLAADIADPAELIAELNAMGNIESVAVKRH